jgi:hypothetical protein
LLGLTTVVAPTTKNDMCEIQKKYQNQKSKKNFGNIFFLVFTRRGELFGKFGYL